MSSKIKEHEMATVKKMTYVQDGIDKESVKQKQADVLELMKQEVQ